MCLYENRAAAAKGFEAQPRLGFGEYAGIVFSPLDKTKIEPDVVVLYCDTAQATAMMVSYNYFEGAMPSFATQASAVCADSVMPVLKNRQPKISIPCAGDRRYEMTQDNEILFSIPAEHVETVIRGMEWRTSRGAPQVYPPARQLWFKPTLNPHYAKLQKSLGKAK